MVRAFLTLSVIGFKSKRLAGRTRVLAGVLAVLMLLLELLASNGAFHQSLHQAGDAASHSCALCLLAHGQVDSSEAMPVLTPAVRPWCNPAPRLESIALVDFTYLSFPSRAPPAVASSLLAVA